MLPFKLNQLQVILNYIYMIMKSKKQTGFITPNVSL